METQVTVKYEEDGGTMIILEGSTIARITPQTDKAGVQKFIQLCNDYVAELGPICKEYQEKLAWNWAPENQGKSKDWPVFRQKEKLVNKLFKQAGLKDT